jgi:hypothetical protein
VEAQKTLNSQGKQSSTGGVTFPDFKLHCRAIASKQHSTGTKTDMNTNGAEQKTQIRIHIYAHLIFDIGAQYI